MTAVEHSPVQLQEARLGNRDVFYFSVTHSADHNCSPPPGFEHIFYIDQEQFADRANQGIVWSGVQAPVGTKNSSEHVQFATDTQILGFTGYGDNPLGPVWKAVAEYARTHGIKAVFPIYANHLITPEVRDATNQLLRTNTSTSSVVFDRDGVQGARYGLHDYTNEYLFASDLYAHIHGKNLDTADSTYVMGHSLGGIAGIRHALNLTAQNKTIAGCFAYGLVAGFSHQTCADDSHLKDGFLGGLLKKPSTHPETLGVPNQQLFEQNQAILALPATATTQAMWFNPAFIRQYQAENHLVLEQQTPGFLQAIARSLTVITADRDGMARPEHAKQLAQYYPAINLEVLADTDHLMIAKRTGAKGNTDALTDLMQSFARAVQRARLQPC